MFSLSESLKCSIKWNLRVLDHSATAAQQMDGCDC